MAKSILALSILACLTFKSYSQATNIYQPNGATTNFGKVTSDSLNYYVVNYPTLTLMKINGINTATLVTTLPVDPFQVMIWNNGKGIYPVASGSPFKLFDGTTHMDISGGQLPMAGYTGNQVISGDYFHKGSYTFFRTSDKIYKTDYSSVNSIQAIAVKETNNGNNYLTEMLHTTNSILYQESKGLGTILKRIDLITGDITKIDSNVAKPFDYGTVYKDEYYYCTPYGTAGASKIYKISDNGTKTLLYTETGTYKIIVRIVGVTPVGVIAIVSTNGIGSEFVSINSGNATTLNYNTVSNSLPSGDGGWGGNSRTTNTLVYFETNDTLASVNSNKALWVTDGTLAGTKKIVGGPFSTFGIDNLSPASYGSAEHCGNDLYFAGRNGANATRLVYVNGSNYAVQTYNFGLPSSFPSIRKTVSGIELIGSPLPTSSVEKAVFKVNCASATGLENNGLNPISFDIFPNPGSGDFTINVSGNYLNSKYKVYNLSGEMVQSGNINQESTLVTLDVKPGFLFLILEISGQINCKKIIVE